MSDDLPPAIDGCSCLCHRQPGVLHVIACCGRGSIKAPQTVQHGDWTIYFDPPPIPVRNCDWHFVHKDYDGASDACDMRYGHAASVEACKGEIDFIEDMERQSADEAKDPKAEMRPIWRGLALASLIRAKPGGVWDMAAIHTAYQYAIGEPEYADEDGPAPPVEGGAA